MGETRTRFIALVKAHSDYLYRHARWLVGDAGGAEDLVQETYARAWRAIGQLRDEGAARGWLLTTLRREHARQFERARPARADVPLEALEDPHRDFDDRTEAQILRRSLRDLPAEYREPLVMLVIGGYTCAEIGVILGVSESAVMSRLFRARQRLRAALMGEEPPAPDLPESNEVQFNELP